MQLVLPPLVLKARMHMDTNCLVQGTILPRPVMNTRIHVRQGNVLSREERGLAVL